jgi:hypothetical protein
MLTALTVTTPHEARTALSDLRADWLAARSANDATLMAAFADEGVTLRNRIIARLDRELAEMRGWAISAANADRQYGQLRDMWKWAKAVNHADLCKAIETEAAVIAGEMERAAECAAEAAWDGEAANDRWACMQDPRGF